jgi:hypothetical protein
MPVDACNAYKVLHWRPENPSIDLSRTWVTSLEDLPGGRSFLDGPPDGSFNRSAVIAVEILLFHPGIQYTHETGESNFQ